MLTISLCMIVYNEEDDIRRCLESAGEFTDEIIVVYTGSTDRTKTICEECGARVYDYKWAGDFSGARNYSISKATSDWVLPLDADEELEIRDPEGLRRYLLDTAYDLIPVRMTHFYGEKPADEKRAYFSSALRLVRNDGLVQFTGEIHERIDVGDKRSNDAADTRQFIRILHYGYMNEAINDKTGRNLSMLLKEKGERPDDPWLSYHLAVGYYRIESLTKRSGR